MLENNKFLKNLHFAKKVISKIHRKCLRLVFMHLNEDKYQMASSDNIGNFSHFDS